MNMVDVHCFKMLCLSDFLRINQYSFLKSMSVPASVYVVFFNHLLLWHRSLTTSLKSHQYRFLTVVKKLNVYWSFVKRTVPRLSSVPLYFCWKLTKQLPGRRCSSAQSTLAKNGTITTCFRWLCVFVCMHFHWHQHFCLQWIAIFDSSHVLVLGFFYEGLISNK